MKATVTNIIEPMSQRTSKAGKSYNASKISLEIETGETADVFAFKEHAIAEVVEVIKKGDFWNIVEPKESPKENVSTAGLEQAFKYLFAGQKKTNELLEGINDLLVEIKQNTTKTGIEKAREVSQSLKKDTVHEPTDLELESGINLDDIPFA